MLMVSMTSANESAYSSPLKRRSQTKKASTPTHEAVLGSKRYDITHNQSICYAFNATHLKSTGSVAVKIFSQIALLEAVLKRER